MPAKSLVTLCIKVSIRNVKSLTDVGDFEYWKIRDVLLRVTSPQQLREIEVSSPQICGEDAELWQIFIARDIPDWKRKNYMPKNPRKWYEVYMKYLREQEQELARSKEQLRQSMMGLQKKKESNVSKVVDAKHLPKLPRDPRMLANNGGVPLGRHKGFAKAPSSVLAFSGGSKTKMTSGQSVILRARREAKEMSARNRLVTPTHQLGGRASQVYRAPQGMLDEHRRATDHPVKILTSRKRSSVVDNQHGSATGPSLEERERRLRALTMSGQKRDSSGDPKPNYVGSEDDDDAGGELEDLFSESKAERVLSPPVRKPMFKPTLQPRSKPTIRREIIQVPASTTSRSAPSATKASASTKSTKPSALISAIISKDQDQEAQHEHSKSQQPLPLPSLAPASIGRGNSPLHGGTRSPPRPLMAPRKRPVVDIFNRGGSAVKKPRIR